MKLGSEEHFLFKTHLEGNRKSDAFIQEKKNMNSWHDNKGEKSLLIQIEDLNPGFVILLKYGCTLLPPSLILSFPFC